MTTFDGSEGEKKLRRFAKDYDDIEPPCICGSTRVKLLKHISVPFRLYNEFSQHEIMAGKCQMCGVTRQINLDSDLSTKEGYVNFYANNYWPNKDTYIAKTYESDRELAELRCDVYGIAVGSKILDVGSGSGAFVDACRDRDAEAYGCDVASYSYRKTDEFIYKDLLENIHFPTDYFDMVVCHDIVEHVLNPIQLLSEIFRITKQQGRFILDFPRYFHEAGEHHWKYEHIWYFDEEQLLKILTDIGFENLRVTHPVESKIVIYCMKPEQMRKSILVPPGIGDSFWSIVKLEAFIKAKDLGIPDVCIVSNHDKKYEGHKRSVPFLQMFPFIHCTGTVYSNGPSRELRKIWKEAYGYAGRTIFEGVHGTDYFISYNGNLRVGKSLDEIDPNLECNWHPPMFKSLEWHKFREDSKKNFGGYIVWYLPFYGTYKYWLKELPLAAISQYINRVTELTECVPVFAGAAWDADDVDMKSVVKQTNWAVDLLGKTSVDEVFGLIEGAVGTIGFPSGLTLMSVILDTKTFMIWNEFLCNENHGKFVWNCCPPDSKGRTYFADNTNNMEDIQAAALRAATAIVGKDNLIIGDGKAVKMRRKRKMIRKTSEVKSKPTSVIEEPTSVIEEPTSVIEEPTPVITIACVLKSGGNFTPIYVERLKNALDRNLTKPFEFVCLSDLEIPCCRSIRLLNGYDRWWSKVELFRLGVIRTERTIYFDLDTIILDNVDDLLDVRGDFLALQPWNKGNRDKGMFASGMMIWNTFEYSFIYSDFDKSKVIQYVKGDQEYMSAELRKHGKGFKVLQEVVPGIYSYKRNCKHGLPKDARIVCFHGKPRPSSVDKDWVKEHWG